LKLDASAPPSYRTRLWASPRYPKWLLLNCLVGMFATTFTVTILTVSLPRLSADINSSRGVIAWVITAPLLASAVAMPLMGRLGDIRGHRRVYLVGFGLAIVFSGLTAVAQNPEELIVSRTLAQLAGASTVPASFAMLFRSFPPAERVRASAWASGTLSGASVTGLVIGGPIIDSIGWRPLFLIQAGLGALALLPAIIILKPDEHRERLPLDLPGALLLATCVFGLTFGVNRLATTGASPWVLGLLATTPLTAWMLVRTERRAPSPLLPVKLVASREVRLVSIGSLVIGGAWTGSFVVTPILLEAVFHYSATTTSLISLCRTASIMMAAPAAARLGRRYGEGRLLVVAAASVAVGMGVLAGGASIQAIAVVIGALILSGWAFGHAQPALVAVMANAVDETHFGTATSLQQTANQIGSVVGLGLISAMAADASTSGPFVRAYLVTAGLAATCALAAMFCRSTHPTMALEALIEEPDHMAVSSIARGL
jgi:MFS family permease